MSIAPLAPHQSPDPPKAVRPPIPMPAFVLAALFPLPLLALGIPLGGVWLWAAFLYMGILILLLDQLIPLATGQTDTTEFPAADRLLLVIGIAALVLLPAATWAISGDSGLSPTDRVLLFLTTGFWLGQVGHPAAHELIHSLKLAPFRLGAAVYTALLFGQHASAHRLVHHRHVASAMDPNSARMGESFYSFAPRAWLGSFRQGLRAETALRQQASRAGLHPYVAYVSGSLAALALATLIAGLPGLLVWAALGLHAQSQILLSDYVQHYGLERRPLSDDRLEPVGPAHSWNTAHWFSSAMMLNAPRHSDHHLHPARAFPALRLPPGDKAPRLPWPLPLACAMALAPRLWRRKLRPLLAPWRETRPADTSA